MSPTGPRSSRSGTRGSRPGPGREPVRSRTPRADAGPADSPAPPETADQPTVKARSSRAAWSGLTTRALALGVVLLVLTISYASSLRIYFDQRHDIAATKIEIAQRQQEIGDLNTEIARWNDPAFVRSQARERLGWVVPGETGYKVIGADGKPVGGGAQIAQQNKPSQTKSEAWWSRLFGSLKIADHPVATDPGAAEPTSEETVGPSPSSSPTR